MNDADVWRWPDRLSLFFDAILTAATVVGVIFLVLQWRQTDAALQEAEEANRIAREAQKNAAADAVEQGRRFSEQLATAQKTAKAAEISASAAKESASASRVRASAAVDALDQSRRSLEMSQRAWIVPENRTEFRLTYPAEVRMTLKNVGHTPAIKSRTQYIIGRTRRKAPDEQIQWDEIILPERWTGGDMIFGQERVLPSSGPDDGGSVIGPNEITEKRFIAPDLNPTDLAAVRDGIAGLIIYVKVVYSDTFMNERTAYICRFYIPADGAVASCPHWNSAD